ncbi:GMP synthase (glutamine-hydrolyzing) [Methanomicrobium sp. W14]|jgi:GMP synthase-like glutamine amidotransferase|uniref:glutamine amidotransferase-related protein n=1 Tax=Methanomicrobium sp. W14 TaxID=2817839 RepID=UPI001AE239A8|nr:gamma-glutamyl-gamma-aminobutyrate hydrolase family protein [Methanomicrobium sp. W14]MBP2132542.1 GMP synthase (glutamine-hydrolyzing) [Methanomicrobium sp. W14]
MILLCDLCYKPGSLSYYEFIKPMERIVKTFGKEYRVVHYTKIDYSEITDFDAVILCGTTLMDNEFLKSASLFEFIKETTVPVLGICAGIQIIAKIFGGKIIPDKKIGMTTVKKIRDNPILKGMDEFEAYELHLNSVEMPECFDTIAESGSGVQVASHSQKPVYGIVFHPEVRNEQVVRNFLEIA